MKRISFVLFFGGLLCALAAPSAKGQNTTHGASVPAGHGAGHVIDHGSGLIKVMILDGQSAGTYHNWRLTTPVLKKELEETGLFSVTVLTAPPSDGDFSQFEAEAWRLQGHRDEYDGPDWPEDLMRAL